MGARYLFIFIISLTLKSSYGEEAEIQCQNENQKCVPLSQCHLEEDNFIYSCHSGLNLICCPKGSHNSTFLETRKALLFPVNCGIIINSDKISGGENADLGQFPWMALLGYRQRGVPFTQFLCGGSVITENYILTAAHCFEKDSGVELVTVRLGEHDLLTEVDCIQIANSKVCSEPYKEYAVEQLIPHPNYDKQKLANDIALVKVKNKIKFTDFIMPICLPFERSLEKRNLTNQKFRVSGWGKTKAANLGGSTVLQYTTVVVWEQQNCSESIPPDVKPLQDSQLCANGKKTEDACKGDSGGPLINATVDVDAEIRWFQVGIVSFASTLTCGNPALPTVYTRIDKYLDWIIDNVS